MSSQSKNLTDMPIDIIKKINSYRPKKVYFPVVVSFDDGNDTYILRKEENELSCTVKSNFHNVEYPEIYFECEANFIEFIFFKFRDYCYQDYQDMNIFTVKIFMSNLMSTTLYIDCLNDHSTINHTQDEFESKVEESLKSALRMLGKMYRYE